MPVTLKNALPNSITKYTLRLGGGFLDLTPNILETKQNKVSQTSSHLTFVCQGTIIKVERQLKNGSICKSSVW